MILFRRDHSQRNRALNLSQEKPAAEIDAQEQENATSEEARPEHFPSGDQQQEPHDRAHNPLLVGHIAAESGKGDGGLPDHLAVAT